MPIRLVYSSKDGCRPSFKHRDGVQENYSPHVAAQFLLFRMPVWGLAGCTCPWGDGNCGAWELHSFGVVLSMSHSSRKYPGRAGADSCARELLLLGQGYFGNQQYYWGGGLWIKKQENVSRPDRSRGCEWNVPFPICCGIVNFQSITWVFIWANLPLKSIPVFYEIMMECLLNCYYWETGLIPISYT